MDFQEELDFALETASKAVELIESYISRREISCEKKRDKSIVTELDKKSKRLITDEVKIYNRANEHNDGLIIEEDETKNKKRGELYADFERIWVADPLDGSRSFNALMGALSKKKKLSKKQAQQIRSDWVKAGGACGVIIGLLEKTAQDYEAVLGVTYNIATGEYIYASRGNGGFHISPKDGRSYPLRQKRSSDIPGMDVVASISRTGNALEMLLNALKPDSVRAMGSSLKAMEVMRNRATLYACPEGKDNVTHIWDLVGPHAIFQEWGGVFTDVYGGPFVWKKLIKNSENRSGILGGHPEVHPEAIERLHQDYYEL